MQDQENKENHYDQINDNTYKYLSNDQIKNIKIQQSNNPCIKQRLIDELHDQNEFIFRLGFLECFQNILKFKFQSGSQFLTLSFTKNGRIKTNCNFEKKETPGIITIGRNEKSDIHINSMSVSSQQCQFEHQYLFDNKILQEIQKKFDINLHNWNEILSFIGQITPQFIIRDMQSRYGTFILLKTPFFFKQDDFFKIFYDGNIFQTLRIVRITQNEITLEIEQNEQFQCTLIINRQQDQKKQFEKWIIDPSKLILYQNVQTWYCVSHYKPGQQRFQSGSKIIFEDDIILLGGDQKDLLTFQYKSS